MKIFICSDPFKSGMAWPSSDAKGIWVGIWALHNSALAKAVVLACEHNAPDPVIEALEDAMFSDTWIEARKHIAPFIG